MKFVLNNIVQSVTLSIFVSTAAVAPPLLDSCSGVNDEYAPLTSEWVENCNSNNGMGKPGLEMYCFSAWQSIRDIQPKNFQCVTSWLTNFASEELLAKK
jgi:hypothetical protein